MTPPSFLCDTTLWPAAISSPFLTGVGDGSLDPVIFKRWLCQDYHYVLAFNRFVAVILAKTPRPYQAPIIQCLNAIANELAWFEDHLQQRGVDLSEPPTATCQAYSDFLVAAAYAEPWPVSMTLLYAAEVSYNAAWGQLLPAKGQYAEFIDRWTNPQFSAFVERLSEICQEHTFPEQQQWFNRVLVFEVDFWQMVTG